MTVEKAEKSRKVTGFQMQGKPVFLTMRIHGG